MKKRQIAFFKPFQAAWMQGKKIVQTLQQEVMTFVKEKGFIKRFVFIYSIYFIGILSMLQANYLYKTDWQRSSGLGTAEMLNWRHSGRPLNDFLTLIFNFSVKPQDISPLTQLLAILFLSVASMILVKCFCKKNSYWALFFSAMLGLSPYYLQVLAYVYDSLFYSMAFLYVVFPFLFYKNDKVFYITSVIGLILAYISWQASISIYMILATYMFYLDWQNAEIKLKDFFKKVIITVLLFLLTSLGYSTVIHLVFENGSAALMQSAVCEWNKCADVFEKNFTKATKGYFFRHWKNTPMGYAFLAVLCSFLIYQIRQGWQNKRKTTKPLNVFVAMATMVCMLFFILLWTMFFTFMYWNARIWVGFGACFAVMMLASTNEKNKMLRRLFMTTSFVLMWSCIIFSNRLGNLWDAQRRYEDFTIFTLSQDLVKFPQKEIRFKTRIVHSPVVLLRQKEYPIFGDLATGMQTKYIRVYQLFFGFYRPDLKKCSDNRVRYKRVLLDNPHHKFTQINDTCLEIDLK